MVTMDLQFHFLRKQDKALCHPIIKPRKERCQGESEIYFVSLGNHQGGTQGFMQMHKFAHAPSFFHLICLPTQRFASLFCAPRNDKLLSCLGIDKAQHGTSRCAL